ncbi:MAG: GGDEF domain-containing protein [Pseudomonadales bacterium]|nr:GGDEF domain-containing protein [Pseudomonadales bacterium]
MESYGSSSVGVGKPYKNTDDQAVDLSRTAHPNGKVAAEDSDSALADFLLANGFSRLHFGGRLEGQYRSQKPAISIGRHRWYLVCGLLITICFGVVDPLLAPDVYTVAWIFRYGLLTPMLTVQLLVSFQSFYPKVEALFSTVTICSVAGTLIFIMKFSDSPLATHYHGLLLLLVLYGNVMTRVKFWHSFSWSIIVMLAYYLNFGITVVSDPLAGYYSSLIAVVCLIGLLANYQVEYHARLDFLHTLLLNCEKERLERMSDELYRVAVVDSLTGLYNRRHFDEALATAWRDAYANETPVSLLFIDVGCFKRFNDTYGHQRGDQCLKVVADTLSRVERRPSDVVARYGGEEFVIILPGMGEAKAVIFAESIRANVESLRIPHRASTVMDCVTVSIGVSTVTPGPDCKPKMIVAQADKALYSAKEEGRNRVCIAKKTKLNLKSQLEAVTPI